MRPTQAVRPAAGMCQAGYRNIFSVTVAPLRERKDDIPLLASYFLEQSAKRLKLRLPRL